MIEKALRLAESGYHVHPVDAESRIPLTEHGLTDATDDSAQITDWWTQWPSALVAVHAGRSGIVVLDVDQKNGKDGAQTLEDNWYEVPETFNYETPTGGFHHVYRAPEGIELSPAAPYRKLEGVDRRGGASYVIWWTDNVPAVDTFAAAPEWLCDPVLIRTNMTYDGSVDEWMADLVEGEPNLLVRQAIKRIPDDMGHSEMVEAQYNAVRLGAEGAPGVPTLLDAIREKWLDRPEGNHTTPRNEWGWKFEEALGSAIQKYGQQIDLMAQLPGYDLSALPPSVNLELLVGQAGDREDFRKALRALSETDLSDTQIASFLWHGPKTMGLAREWGIDLVYTRIKKARVQPEPTRENPTIPDTPEPEAQFQNWHKPLLTDEERDYLKTRPSFVDKYLEVGASNGFANPTYFRSCAWAVASMAFAFRGFIPVSGSDKMGLNLWNITLGESGTGKSRAQKFRDSVLNFMFDADNDETGYNLGSDSSPQGLQMALLQRDRQPSLFAIDEASRFFKQLAKNDWMSSLDDTLSHWYEGRVDPSNKINLKDLRGKAALTSFHIHMFATPDRLTEVVTRDMFLTGFLARFNWGLGDPPRDTDDRFTFLQQETPTDFFDESEEVKALGMDLIGIANVFGSKPHPLLADEESLNRLSEAYRQMFRQAQHDENWDVIEPSITRLAETLRKCAAICAMYRGDDTIRRVDALHAIQAVQEWYDNVFEIARMISSGEFQRRADSIEAWIRARPGATATKPSVYHAFRNLIAKDPRELDSILNFLVESGRVNRTATGQTIKFEINGG